MLELMLSLPAALLRFKYLNAVSNYSVAKPEWDIDSLRDIECSLQFVETGGLSFENQLFVKK